MRRTGLPLAIHLILLLVFLGGMVAIWYLPIALIGMPPRVPDIGTAADFARTAVTSTTDGRLTPIILAFFTRWIPWMDFSRWMLLPIAASALALLPWWGTVSRLADRRTAWMATIILGFIPLYWQQALLVNNYTFSFLFLFGSLFFFISLWPISRLAALMTSGISFGLCIATKDAFIIFLPWLVGLFLWWNRHSLLRTCGETFLFLACIGIAFSLPILPQILRSDATPMEKIMTLLPTERLTPSLSHFYPDRYTEEFDRAWFDAKRVEEQKNARGLQKLQGFNRFISLRIGSPSLLQNIGNGLWLFVGSIPDYFLQETVGGAILWLFILPGIAVLFRFNRRLLLAVTGLVFSSEFLIRFVFHFSRIHVLNTIWVFAIFAAIGIGALADALAKKRGFWHPSSLAAVITLLLAMQLLQTNRLQLARAYMRSDVPRELATSHVLATMPPDGLAAVPRDSGLPQLIGRSVLAFRPETIDRLLQQGKLRKTFSHYGVTHAFLYDPSLAQRMTAAVPTLRILPQPDPPELPPLSPLTVFLLHTVR